MTYPAPEQPAATTSATPAPGASGLDIAALVLAIVAPLVGLILGIVSRSQAKRAGRAASGLSLAAVIIGAILTGLTVIAVVIMVVVSALAFSTVSRAAGEAADAAEIAQSCVAVAGSGDTLAAFAVIDETAYIPNGAQELVLEVQSARDAAMFIVDTAPADSVVGVNAADLVTDLDAFIEDASDGSWVLPGVSLVQGYADEILEWSNANCGSAYSY